MTPERIAEIKQRCEAATPGPWFWRGGKAKPLTLHAGNMDIVMCFCRSGMSAATAMFNVRGLLYKATELMKPRQGQEHNASFMSDVDHPDAQFIAKAREDVPALLTAVESLQADNARLRAALVQARSEIITPSTLAAIDAALEDAR